MRIKNPGNFQSILSSRCSMDAMKYSRVLIDSFSNQQSTSQLNLIPEGIKIKIKASLERVDLSNNLSVYLSKDPHSWFIADNSFLNDLNSSNLKKIDKEDLLVLYKKGLLSINEKFFQPSELFGRYAVRSDNVALISLTDHCNLKCPHCVANANANYLTGTELTFKELDLLFKNIAQENNPYGFSLEKKVFISGGEPSIREDLEEISLSCADQNLSTHICTNGLLISPKILKNLKDKKIAFSVSLDGEKINHEIIRGYNTFNPTIEKIKLMCNNGFDVFINTFLHQGNLNDMDYLVNFGAETGVKGINFIRAIPRGRGKNMEFKRVPDKILFRKTYQLMKKDINFYKLLENENTFSILALSALSGVKSLNCGLSRDNYFFLDSVGNIFPCPGMRYDEFLIGNLRTSSFKNLLIKKKNNSLSDLKADSFPVCSTCDFVYFCGGDCRGSAYGNDLYKNIKSPVPYCFERKESLLEMFTILGEDPTFLRDKSKWIIKNSEEETNARNKN